jgi:hypothetical protein
LTYRGIKGVTGALVREAMKLHMKPGSLETDLPDFVVMEPVTRRGATR